MREACIILLLFCFELHSDVLYAQDTEKEQFRIESRILFPFARHDVNTGYWGNADSIRSFLAEWEQLSSDSTNVIDKILFLADTSPEGNRKWNAKLVRWRNQSFHDYLATLISMPADKVEFVLPDKAWAERQKRLKSTVLPWVRKQELRRSTIEVYWHKELPPLALAPAIVPSMEEAMFGENIAMQPSEIILPTLPSGALLPALPAGALPFSQDSIKRLYSRFAIKTNLLYWAAAIPNVEAEYYFADRWSFNMEVQYAWWSKKPTFFYRLAAGSPEVRYWLSDKERFRGHFLGAYIGGGLYEFMFERSFGLQGEFYIAGGISYGYTTPIGKGLRMEFSVGVGYLTTHYRQYYYDAGCYVYQRTRRYSYLGPTKVKVALVLPLFIDKGKIHFGQ